VNPRKKKTGKGELLLCGLGIDRPSEVTLATIEALKSCDVAFYIHGDGAIVKAFLEPFCPDVRLFSSKRPAAAHKAKPRLLAEAVCAELKRGRRVAYVTYGHPSLFSDAGNVAFLCRGRGYACRVLPALSSVDGVIAALHAREDFGILGRGFLACLADQALEWDEPGRPDVAWVLLGVDRLVERGRFASLCERIQGWYPPEHRAWAVKCADGRGQSILTAGTVAGLRGWETLIRRTATSLALAPVETTGPP